jgi:asparagine synthetase B (glutamine-hydrolysing)
MIFNKVSSTNKVKSLNYYENLNDKYNNPYFEYENNNDFISLKTDNLSVHNFFYYFDSENFILNSEFISLIEDISKLNVKIILDKKTIYTFLTTNTFLGNKTFIKNIYKIMPGEMIYFSKSTKKLEIKKIAIK